MAKRPSLLGTGRDSLRAATSKTPVVREPAEEAPVVAAAEVIPPRQPRRRPRQPMATESTSESREVDARMKSAVGPFRPPYARQLGGMVAIFEELAIFGGERLDRTLATGQALSQCRNPVDALAVQMQFACNTAAHYAAESLKLMRLASAAWSGGWNTV